MALPPPPSPRALAYLGSPELAVAPLEALVAAGYDVRLVVSRPDKRRGRGGVLTPSPVKAAAERLGLAVSSKVDDILDCGAELGVVVAFGQLIKPHVLARLPLVNVHFSLLPRWRGAAPVERAILAGDAVTGVCLMALEEELDVGGVYRRAEIAVQPHEALDDLRGRLVALGTDLLLDALAQGFGPAEPQRGEVTYAAKVTADELALDWRLPAEQLARVVRLGRAWTTFRGRRLLVHSARPVESLASDAALAPAGPGSPGPGSIETGPGGVVTVACGLGSLRLLSVQPEGRAVQTAAAWRNGAQPLAGERLGA